MNLKGSKKTLVIAAVVTLVGVVGYGVYQRFVVVDDEVISPSEFLGEASHEWKLFHNAQLGFKLEYPASWSVIERNTDRHKIALFDSATDQSRVTVSNVGSDATLAKIGADSLEGWVASIVKTSEPPHKIVHQKKVNIPNNINAIEVLQRFDFGDYSRTIYLEKDRKFYYIELYTPKVITPTLYQYVFEHILFTFEPI